MWFFLAAFILVGYILFIATFDTYRPPVGSVLERLVQVDARATYRLTGFVLFYLGLSVWVFVLATKAVRTRQWPPAGVAVPFRTEIREIRKPFKVWAYVAILVCIYGTAVASMVYERIAMHAMVQAALRAYGPTP
jgi:hypothetical protein